MAKTSQYLGCLLMAFMVGMYGKQPATAQTIRMFDLGYTLEGDYADPDIAARAWEHVHAFSTLQGVVNRHGPNLYGFFVKNGNHDIDRYWWGKYREDGAWLAGADTLLYTDIESLVLSYKDSIAGAVVYDPHVPATSNVASAVAGSDNLIAIRYSTSEHSLYHRLVKQGMLPVEVWLINENGQPLFTGNGTIPGTTRPSSGSAKNDAYRWFIEHYIKEGKCNTAFGAYYIDQAWIAGASKISVKNHHTLTNHDYFVSNKAFFFDLSPWGNEPATDDPTQRLGTDLETLKELLLLAYNENGNGDIFTHIGGFPPWAFKYTRRVGGKHGDVATEWEYSRIISAYNAFKDADAIGYGALANASFWQHYPLREAYPQRKVSNAELIERGYLTEAGGLADNGKEYMVFYVGDYDAASWLSQTTPTLWDDANRGQVPLMWSISPVLARRVPMAMEYRWLSASSNDYFAAADNGAGYLMPGMLQVPRDVSGLPDGTRQWAEHNLPYYKQWGLSITGFVIDGEAPAMDRDGLDAYARFSPDGIVPQKAPQNGMLHGNMPVFKSGEDVQHQDPLEAARVIVGQIDGRTLRFHWFRNILKSPTWYVQVVEEINRLNPDVELLDAPTFFALYRISLMDGLENKK